MTTRMLIDAAHPEETRVVVVHGTRLEEFDFESSTKRQLKGNIYLAKVTRVEPSLQAAFVDYGGNRHGFLALSEIHPDYYQIPIADRKVLLDEEAAEEEALGEAAEGSRGEPMAPSDEAARAAASEGDAPAPEPDASMAASEASPAAASAALLGEDGGAATTGEAARAADAESSAVGTDAAAAGGCEEAAAGNEDTVATRESVDTMGGDDLEDAARARRQRLLRRRYKIQEVIRRRQILLVQVVKEERGTKGAALTTYLSLAGRYCVLMPNTPRGGGISRRIAAGVDRTRLKSIMESLEIPAGMSLIMRTAGVERSRAEIKRDLEYLLRLWDEVRERTLTSTAPRVVHEEAELIRRAIRDLYSKDIEEILVEGSEGYKRAKSFMRMLIPSHAKVVQPYEERIPLFQRYQVEQQLDSMHSPTVQLKSGGYIVMNATEALVAIDVNSGRSTRERNIEETALRTNLQAAEEVARQLRLRDLAGLVVVDFIDMEVGRNVRSVERRFKECLKADRARIQVGRISPFGLLEMSRQRLRPSLIETSTEACPRCAGTGVVRSTESTALHVLRQIEEEGLRERSREIKVHLATAPTIYLLNEKRQALSAIEARYQMRVSIAVDDSLIPPNSRIDRVAGRTPQEAETRGARELVEVAAEPSEAVEAAEAMPAAPAAVTP
ncbi:MAG: ribonuclease E/G, partial [Alphaproteobacteria bacterium]|nr:ribonuclease E/G [Alphaproteobacteria bacterium]